MTLWGIFISAFLIGFSGAMMPGPMLGVVVEGSLKKGWSAGPLTVLGHGILELGLIIVMILGLKDFFSNPMVAGAIGLFGGAYLGWMGYGMIKASVQKSVSLEQRNAGRGNERGNLILAGALISATNPYFIMWWASTGIESLRRSYNWGAVGVLCFFLGHILSDLTWYSAISVTFSRGKRLISDTIYQRTLLVLGIFLMGFSIYFMGTGYRMLNI